MGEPYSSRSLQGSQNGCMSGPHRKDNLYSPNMSLFRKARAINFRSMTGYYIQDNTGMLDVNIYNVIPKLL